MNNTIWQTVFLDGIPPSKKNGKRIAGTKGKKPMLLSSKAYLSWERGACLIFKSGFKPVSKCKLGVTFFVSDKRKFDIDNKLTSIMDCLVKSGIIPDDNWGVIPEISSIVVERPELGSETVVSIGGI